MPYLNIDLDFADHPKTRRLNGLTRGNAEGLLVRLWCYTGKYHRDSGRLAGYSDQEIESIVRWEGEPGKLVEALCTLGWLHQDQDGYRVHDWADHQGHLPALQERAKKGAAARWGKINDASSNAYSNAPSIAKQSSYPSPSLPSPPDVLKDKTSHPPTSERRKKPRVPIVHWGALIDFIKKRFQAKRPDDVWEFSDKDAGLLAPKARAHGVPKLMALYVLYLRTSKPWYQEHGYDLPTFCGAIGWLIDQPGWKPEMVKFDHELNSPKTPEQKAVVQELASTLASMTNGKVGNHVAEIQKGNQAAGKLSS